MIRKQLSRYIQGRLWDLSKDWEPTYRHTWVGGEGERLGFIVDLCSLISSCLGGHSGWNNPRVSKEFVDRINALSDAEQQKYYNDLNSRIQNRFCEHVYSGSAWGTEKQPKPERPE